MTARRKPSKSSSVSKSGKAMTLEEVEIVGNKVILRGQAERQVKAFCRSEGCSPKVLLTEMLRVFVERFKVEKPKRVEDIDWQAYAERLVQRLRKRETKTHAP